METLTRSDVPLHAPLVGGKLLHSTSPDEITRFAPGEIRQLAALADKRGSVFSLAPDLDIGHTTRECVADVV